MGHLCHYNFKVENEYKLFSGCVTLLHDYCMRTKSLVFIVVYFKKMYSDGI